MSLSSCFDNDDSKISDSTKGDGIGDIFNPSRPSQSTNTINNPSTSGRKPSIGKVTIVVPSTTKLTSLSPSDNNHNFVEVLEVGKSPTCEEDGLKVEKCMDKNCNVKWTW